MNRVLGGLELRAAGAAFLLFAAILFAAPTPSAAASYTLAFNGTVTSASAGSLFATVGVVAGDPISGTLTIDPLNESPTSVMPLFLTEYSQASLTYNFQVSHGATNLAFSETGNGTIDSSEDGIGFVNIGGFSQLEFSVHTTATAAMLSTLAGLPNSPGALIAMLGGAPVSASGFFDLHAFGDVEFDIDAAVAPIPATLPLFVSALGGLGFAAWRRRVRPAST
jgi:hypothetical protein